MPKIKSFSSVPDVPDELENEKDKILPLETDFGRDDLNALAAKVNEIITKLND